MGIDVIDFLARDARLLERLLHRAVVADAVRVRGERMVGFAASPVRDEFRVNFRAPPECVCEFLENHVARAFAEHEAVARLVERSHSPLRIVGAPGHHVTGAQAAPCRLDDGCLRPAGDHHVQILVADHSQRVSDRIVPRRTARTDRHRVAFDSEFVRDLATPRARRTADDARDRHATIAALEEGMLGFVGRLVVAHRRSLGHSAAIGVHLGKIDLRVIRRQPRSRDAELQAAVQPTRGLVIHVGVRLEVAHFRADLAGDARHVEARQKIRRAPAVADAPPERVDVAPVRGDHSDAGDDDAPRVLAAGAAARHHPGGHCSALPPRRWM